MTEKIQRPTATIYQFPVSRLSSRGASPKPYGADRLADSLERPVCGSGWYHDAAILDADQSGRRH